VFGNVFGNTIYSASFVVAAFMLGLGAGSYIGGVWADRRYAAQPESLIRVYGYVELIIAATGFGISSLLPHLDRFSAAISSYSRESSGWYVLSLASYAARAATAVVLLAPITLLMGATLTLLIRHLVRRDVDADGRRVAFLYGINTVGAALGAWVTDFALVPAFGIFAAQMVAVLFNVIAGGGALAIADCGLRIADWKFPIRNGAAIRPKPAIITKPAITPKSAIATKSAITNKSAIRNPQSAMVALALALSGFAAMGMEILWFRHFTILLGQLRAVFSLLLTIILIGIGAGSLISTFVYRRTGRAAELLIIVQGLFIIVTLLGLAIADAKNIEAIVLADPAYLAAAGRAPDTKLTVGFVRTLTEAWFNAKPMLLEVGLPALLMGFAFPLANAIVQRAEGSVGRRAGALYLANTSGAVCGSLATGFVLLATMGIQTSAAVLSIIAALAIVPLHLGTRNTTAASSRVAIAVSFPAAVAACGLWLSLPASYVNTRALRPMESERLLTVSEGMNEILAVTEMPGRGRRLLTNGHPMSATTRLSQRYMRALAHIPLLCIDRPETVLVIGFGVGNTTHAATLHPSVRRVEVADLSRDVLRHASYFADVNGRVLDDPRVSVYVNDGRHHLHMTPTASYDLITLEPPPIGYAGMAALYSREFYALARTRLAPNGYMSQWLPAYQVPAATTLAMIRAFVDEFPHAVLLSGAEADLLLVGANASRIEIDPERLAAALGRAPAVQADLQRLDLGSVTEIVGTFLGSPRTLADATRNIDPVTDDRPIQEYGVRSLLHLGDAVPASVVDLTQVALWCPACFAGGRVVPAAEGLDTYLALLGRAYSASPSEMAHLRQLSDRQPRAIAGSAYLGAVVPDSAELHNTLGITLAEKGNIDQAIGEFREAARLAPDSAGAHWHLGAALAMNGTRDEAIEHLRRAVELDPDNGDARRDLDIVLASVPGRRR
jgi:predicted membrane-bound spermidine synthase